METFCIPVRNIGEIRDIRAFILLAEEYNCYKTITTLPFIGGAVLVETDNPDFVTFVKSFGGTIFN